MSYALLTSLLPLLESFERAFPGETDPQRFAAWLSLQAQHTPEQTGTPVQEEQLLLQSFLFFSRYIRGYARKALEGSPLHTVDEYAYLVAVRTSGSLTKSALIQQQRHEKPTGMEIIKRLLDLKLLVQQDDPEDRRSKRLSLTPAGATLVDSLAPGMQQVGRITAGNLSPVERTQLLHILQKLEAFHQLVQAKLKG